MKQSDIWIVEVSYTITAEGQVKSIIKEGVALCEQHFNTSSSVI
jgi:hypothetical protein